MADNNITVSGNITRDPELRFTQTGRATASFGIAVNRRWQQNGEWQEEVSFFNVVAWASLAENCAASLNKGSRVVVSGRLQQRSWESNEGEKRSVVEIVADDIGASLKWATVDISRVERSDSTSSQRASAPSGGGYSEDPF